MKSVSWPLALFGIAVVAATVCLLALPSVSNEVKAAVGGVVIVVALSIPSWIKKLNGGTS
jgi:hypothetical protein